MELKKAIQIVNKMEEWQRYATNNCVPKPDDINFSLGEMLKANRTIRAANPKATTFDDCTVAAFYVMINYNPSNQPQGCCNSKTLWIFKH